MTETKRKRSSVRWFTPHMASTVGWAWRGPIIPYLLRCLWAPEGAQGARREQLGLEPVPVWDAGAAGGVLTRCTTVLAWAYCILVPTRTREQLTHCFVEVFTLRLNSYPSPPPLTSPLPLWYSL